jgi:hypothetical protein
MASDTEERASPGLVLGAGAIDAAGKDGQALISIVAAGTTAARWSPGVRSWSPCCSSPRCVDCRFMLSVHTAYRGEDGGLCGLRM